MWGDCTIIGKRKPGCLRHARSGSNSGLLHHDSRSKNVSVSAGTFCYRKSTKGTTIAAIEVNNDMYCLQNQIEKITPYTPILLLKIEFYLFHCNTVNLFFALKLNVLFLLDFITNFLKFKSKLLSLFFVILLSSCSFIILTIVLIVYALKHTHTEVDSIVTNPKRVHVELCKSLSLCLCVTQRHFHVVHLWSINKNPQME